MIVTQPWRAYTYERDHNFRSRLVFFSLSFRGQTSFLMIVFNREPIRIALLMMYSFDLTDSDYSCWAYLYNFFLYLHSSSTTAIHTIFSYYNYRRCRNTE